MVERLPLPPKNVPGWIAWAIREDYQCRWLGEVWSHSPAPVETSTRQDFSDLAAQYNGDDFLLKPPPPSYVGDPQAKVYWDVTYEELKMTISRPTFDMWLRLAKLLSVEGNVYRIGVPNAYAQEWLTQKFKPLICKMLGRVARAEVDVEFQVST